MTLRQAYDVLNLTPGVSLNAAQPAYRGLVTQWHPDQFEEGTARYDRAQRRLKRINRAYARLQESTAAERRALPRFPSASAPRPDTLRVASSHATRPAAPTDQGEAPRQSKRFKPETRSTGITKAACRVAVRRRGWASLVGVAASVGVFCWGVLSSPGLGSLLAWTAPWIVLAVGALMFIPERLSRSA